MRDGLASVTAQRVAAYRLTFDRPAASYGDAAADERLATDVAGSADFERRERMGRYLRARTDFFDQAVITALDRRVAQVLAVGAGYDGRSLRYAKPGVRWFEVDHPATQRDKRARLRRLGIEAGHVTFVSADLREAGLGQALVMAGFDPGAPAQLICEGVAVYLDVPVLHELLAELRALATAGTRLALSTSPSPSMTEPSARERFRAAVAAVGEPARSMLSEQQASDLLHQARWQPLESSEISRRLGFIVAAPAGDNIDGPLMSLERHQRAIDVRAGQA